MSNHREQNRFRDDIAIGLEPVSEDRLIAEDEREPQPQPQQRKVVIPEGLPSIYYESV